MSTFTTHHLTPKSLVRYRPSDYKFVLPLGMPRRASRYNANAKESHEASCSSLMRKQLYISSRLHWVVLLAVAMLATWLLLLTALQVWLICATWWKDLRYGRPRVTAVSAFVGHETGTTASQFLAINQQGEVRVIEFPGGDSNRARIYQGPILTGEGADLLPVTLSFADRNADHHLDLIIQVGGFERWYRNEKGSFLQTEPGSLRVSPGSPDRKAGLLGSMGSRQEHQCSLPGTLVDLRPCPPSVLDLSQKLK